VVFSSNYSVTLFLREYWSHFKAKNMVFSRVVKGIGMDGIILGDGIG
jgi:hypothetical protein